MAASNFIIYNKAIVKIATGIINLSSSPIWAVSLHSGYTPSTNSHSTYAQIVQHISSAGGVSVPQPALGSKTCTNSGGVATKFDSADINGFTRGGSLFISKYVALYAPSASGGGNDNPLLGWLDLNTSSATGVEASQINLTVPAGGWFKINTN